MDANRRDRRALKREITNIEDELAPHDVTNSMSNIDIGGNEKSYEACRHQYRQLLNKCSAIATTDAIFDAENPDFQDIRIRLDNVYRKLEQLKEHAVATKTTTTGTSDVKLPKLELPTFSGEVKDWISFQDLFTASVHNNGKLSGGQKLQYLKASLKGEAATLLQNIPVTDLNYDGAWITLKTRYENKREIIKSHFDKLLSLPALNQENPDAFRRIGDSTNECIRALDVMTLTPEQSRDLLLIHLMSRKFDTEGRLEWEKSLKKDAIPTIKEFTDFILQHARVTAAAGIKSKNLRNDHFNQKNASSDTKKKTSVHHGTQGSSDNCKLCKKSKHYLNRCEEFLKMSRHDRSDFVKKGNRCFNCLEPSHSASECTWSGTCKNCNAKHNTLLHFDKLDKSKKKEADSDSKEPEVKEEENKGAAAHFSCNFGTGEKSLTLLSTALVEVKNKKNQIFVCRALLDCGSQTSFITKKCATKLGLKQHKVNLPISGLGELDVGTSQMGVNLEFSSQYKSEKTFNIETYVIARITGELPTERINVSEWKHINGLQLADPYFHEPGNIDILLGGDVYEDLMKTNRRKGPDGAPWARESYLGWVLIGQYRATQKQQPVRTHFTMSDFVSRVNTFMDLEDIPVKPELSLEERKCEEHFEITHSCDAEGRYVVKLPFKEKRELLGESRAVAVKCLQSMERRYSKSPEKINQYNVVLQEYLDLGHMEKVPSDELSVGKEVYYMPFHVVLNSNSSTTPVRVVFNASAKSKTGLSLNESLMVGPKLQDDLIAILMRFRQHKIVLSADITKMYRQVKVATEDCDYQRIVWRKSKHDDIEDFRLTTATFGTASAPYHAVKCVQTLAESEKKKYPEAAAVILRDFYVDDLMSGASSLEEGLKLQEQLVKLLQLGHFELRKWSSNDMRILEALPPEMRETKLTREIDLDSTIKTLGLLWHPAEDHFSFSVAVSESPASTKTHVLSEMAKIFDPLGWLSPVTVKAKMFFQELWRLDLGWDDPISEEHQVKWRKYTTELMCLKNLKIPRRCTFGLSENYFLDGFCDASEQAYAAVVYLRTEDENGNRITRLVAAKTKVVPVKKKVSLPRLELCGALILTKLMKCVKEALTLEIKEISVWTDSTIVLAWIARNPTTLKTFVGNRVSKIQEFLPSEHWAHIRGVENPADCASRGIFPAELESHELWWNGPNYDFLFEVRSTTTDEELESEEFLSEIKNSATTVLKVTTPEKPYDKDRIDTLMKKHSNWKKMQRLVAYILRYVDIKLNKSEVRFGQPQTPVELRNAVIVIVKNMQVDERYGFQEEIEKLKQNKKLSKSFRKLTPFIDVEGVLRVGGRLENADVNVDKKNPMLISSEHPVTRVIVRYYHKEYKHAGPQLLLTLLQEQFWIVGGRNFIKKIVRSCVRCARERAKTCKQIMGQLPQARVNPARAFLHCGVDYAGPFKVKNCRGRNPIQYKVYVAVFICLATRAVNLELVSDMTTESFLQTFKRFVATRGKPSDVYSDCGSNFVGADNDVKEYMEVLNHPSHQKEIRTYMTNNGIQWHFNAPYGPHHGGIWEAAVKSMKFHLKRVVGTTLLNFEEMLTILKQIEACLNSRPLSSLSTDPADLAALTPGHFLIGDIMTAVPEPDLRLLVDDDEPPLKWKLGRIIEVNPGPDKKVRVVKVRTQDGELTRPVVKLCPVPVEGD